MSIFLIFMGRLTIKRCPRIKVSISYNNKHLPQHILTFITFRFKLIFRPTYNSSSKHTENIDDDSDEFLFTEKKSL